MNNTEEVEKLYSVRRSGSILGGEICLLCGQWGTILLENVPGCSEMKKYNLIHWIKQLV
jgi:hypothetical protein